MNIKRITASLVLVLVAVATGISVGKIYVDSTTEAMEVVDESEEELRASDEYIISLVEQAQSGAAVTDFSGVELYQIAEYNLNSCDSFLKNMAGTSKASGQTIPIRSQKIKSGNTFVSYKVSPSKTINLVVAKIATPTICTRTVYNLNQPNKIYVSNDTTGTSFTNTSSKETLDAVFDSSTTITTQYSKDDYIAAFLTTPKTSNLSYIISANTVSDENVSAVTSNGDGTYSFTITLSGKSAISKAALYYTYEIMHTCGYSNPTLTWSNVEIVVTIDENFRFTTISYTEDYKITSADIPVVGSANVTDEFVDTFYYDVDETFLDENALSDYSANKGGF